MVKPIRCTLSILCVLLSDQWKDVKSIDNAKLCVYVGSGENHKATILQISYAYPVFSILFLL